VRQRFPGCVEQQSFIADLNQCAGSLLHAIDARDAADVFPREAQRRFCDGKCGARIARDKAVAKTAKSGAVRKLGGKHDGDRRDRTDHVADLSKDQDLLHHAEARPATFLRQRDRKPAQLGKGATHLDRRRP